MKRLFFVMQLMIAFQAALHADFTTESIGSETLTPPSRRNFGGIQADGDYIGRSKFSNSFFKGEKIGYSEWEVTPAYTFLICPDKKEAFEVGIGYSQDSLVWQENPFFHEQLFKNIRLSLGCSSERLERWIWQAQGFMNINIKGSNIWQYATYDVVLWGRYAYFDCLGVNLGALGFTGLQINRVYPIVGFDWRFFPAWQLNLIFPVNLSLVYTPIDNFSLALATRFFFSRNRVDKSAELSQGVYEYRNPGIELGAKYTLGPLLLATLHGGYTLGGRLRIWNRSHKEGRRFDFNGAPYAGAEVALHF